MVPALGRCGARVQSALAAGAPAGPLLAAIVELLRVCRGSSQRVMSELAALAVPIGRS